MQGGRAAVGISEITSNDGHMIQRTVKMAQPRLLLIRAMLYRQRNSSGLMACRLRRRCDDASGCGTFDNAPYLFTLVRLDQHIISAIL